MSQYVYSAQRDALRVVIFRIDPDAPTDQMWDVDVFLRHDTLVPGKQGLLTVSALIGERYYTKRDAKVEMERVFGKLRSISPRNTVTAGWGRDPESEFVSESGFPGVGFSVNRDILL